MLASLPNESQSEVKHIRLNNFQTKVKPSVLKSNPPFQKKKKEEEEKQKEIHNR